LRKLFPSTRRKVAQFKPADANAQEAQGGMPDGGGHAADLAVFALDEFKSKPDGGNAFAGANGGMARRDVGLWFEQPRFAGESLSALDEQAFLKLTEIFQRGNIFDLRPIKTGVALARVEKFLIERGFIAEQEQALGIRVQSANGINAFGETEIGERAIGRVVGRKLGNHAVGFMESDEHS
jgi:hypothetical protein